VYFVVDISKARFYTDNMERKQAIVYVRASTNEARQVNSHALQLLSIREFCKRHNYEIVQEFTEYASGTLDERPVFNACLAYASKHDTMIISYRLDRLSRSLTVFNRLAPHLHRLRFATQGDQELNLIVISVLLSMAHAESKANSERVKMAYKTLKARDPDYKWGSDISDEVRAMAKKVRVTNAKEFNSYITSVVIDLRNAGYSFKDIPQRLNQLHITTRRGSLWEYHNLMRIVRTNKEAFNAERTTEANCVS